MIETGGSNLAPVPAPAAGGGVLGVVISILGSLLGIAFGGGQAGQLEQQITQLRDQTTQALHQILSLATDIARALAALLEFLHDLWTGLAQWILALLKMLRNAMRWLLKVGLPALMQAIHNLRKLLDQIYQRYIRPALQYLQLIRKYLAILRLLHVPFAAALDKWLVRLQGRILWPFYYVLRTINGLGSWFNVILTAGIILQKPVFLNTMYAYTRTWTNLWWEGQSAAGGAGSDPGSMGTVAPRTGPQILDDFNALTHGGGGPIAATGALSMITFQSVLSGGPAIPGSFHPPMYDDNAA